MLTRCSRRWTAYLLPSERTNHMSTPPPNLPPPSPARPDASPHIGTVSIIIAVLSFIPMIGLPFGIVACIWGGGRRSWLLAVLGAGGILLNVVLYGSLFYFGFYQRGGPYDALRSQMAVTMLNSAVKEVEFYKLQHGHYPAALSELDTKDVYKFPSVIDPTAMERGNGKDAHFFYELDPAGRTYFLRSVGPDGIPFTADDILPSLSEDERKNTGLKLER